MDDPQQHETDATYELYLLASSYRRALEKLLLEKFVGRKVRDLMALAGPTRECCIYA